MPNKKGQGRKPKPTHLKLLHGEPNKDRINKDEPKAPPLMSKSPTWLDYEAKKEWKRLAPQLLNSGVLTEWDMANFASYCATYSKMVKAEKELKALIKIQGNKGLLFPIKNPDGTVRALQTNPFIWIINKCIEQLRSLGSEFGLTPSSRTRIKVNRDYDDDEDFFT